MGDRKIIVDSTLAKKVLPDELDGTELVPFESVDVFRMRIGKFWFFHKEYGLAEELTSPRDESVLPMTIVSVIEDETHSSPQEPLFSKEEKWRIRVSSNRNIFIPEIGTRPLPGVDLIEIEVEPTEVERRVQEVSQAAERADEDERTRLTRGLQSQFARRGPDTAGPDVEETSPIPEGTPPITRTGAGISPSQTGRGAVPSEPLDGFRIRQSQSNSESQEQSQEETTQDSSANPIKGFRI